jgi:hypothetical protein
VVRQPGCALTADRGLQGASEKKSVVENKEALIFITSAKQRVCRGTNVAGKKKKKNPTQTAPYKRKIYAV